ncbi:hypothetical protein DL764_006637 [Monosporascus ibericus]|uniref:Uncharacterized protein n=1 Tax=Monosporascus ibericus TaxID=155417 RepID=A0A4Q4T490_9PEZI|nr:hypothetical protein DL764_006637 [Monosporascus ibericus]
MPFRDCLLGAGPLRNLQMQHQSGDPVSCGRCDGCKERQKLAERASTGADSEFRRGEWAKIPWWINGMLGCVFFFLVAVLGMCVLNLPTDWFLGASGSAEDVIPRTEMLMITAVLSSEVSLPDCAPIYSSESAEAPIVPVSDHDSTYPSGPADEVSKELEGFASSLWVEKLGSLAASEAKTTSEDKTTSEETSLEAEQSMSEAELTGESTRDTVSTSPTADSKSSETVMEK